MGKYLNEDDASSEWKLYAFLALERYRNANEGIKPRQRDRLLAIRAILMLSVSRDCDEHDTPKNAAAVLALIVEWVREWDAAQEALERFVNALGAQVHADDAMATMRLICAAWEMMDAERG